MKYLGDTLEKIAGEKAGIAKPGRPVRDRRAGAGAGGRCCAARPAARSRGSDPVGPRRRPGDAARLRVDADRSAWRARTSAGTPPWRTAILMALPAPYRPDAGGARPAASPRRGSRAGSTGGASGCSTSPTIPTASARSSRRSRRSARRGRSTAWSRSWATRSGPRCWCSSTARSTAGSSPSRPPRPAAAGTPRGSGAGSGDASRPPARASWTLVPDFARRSTEVQRGAGTVLVTGSFHTVGDVMGGARTLRAG